MTRPLPPAAEAAGRTAAAAAGRTAAVAAAAAAGRTAAAAAAAGRTAGAAAAAAVRAEERALSVCTHFRLERLQKLGQLGYAVPP